MDLGYNDPMGSVDATGRRIWQPILLALVILAVCSPTAARRPERQSLIPNDLRVTDLLDPGWTTRIQQAIDRLPSELIDPAWRAQAAYLVKKLPGGLLLPAWRMRATAALLERLPLELIEPDWISQPRWDATRGSRIAEINSDLLVPCWRCPEQHFYALIRDLLDPGWEKTVEIATLPSELIAPTWIVQTGVAFDDPGIAHRTANPIAADPYRLPQDLILPTW